MACALTAGLLLSATGSPAAAQTPPTSGFCIDNVASTPDRPGNPADCVDGERYLTAAEKAQLDKIRDDGTNTAVDAALGNLGSGNGNVGIPAAWYLAPEPCNSLPSTRLNGENRLVDVYNARTAQFIAQVAYDIASNEISGVAGAITGSILGALSIPVFALEYVYDVQDECQEIQHRLAVDAVAADLTAQSNRLDAHATEVRNTLAAISTALADHDATVTTLINDQAASITATVNDQAANVTNTVNDQAANVTNTVNDQAANVTATIDDQTTNLTAQIADHDAHLQAETDELDGAVSEARDESLMLVIEDHLETCRPLASQLISAANGGYSEQVFDLVDTLMAGAEADGFGIGKARRFFDTASAERDQGDARKAFRSLCTAYNHVVKG